MLFASKYSRIQMVYPGVEITQRDLRAFRAQVGLALAASDSVVVNLTRTNRFDSWALLEILDLAGKFAPRLTFETPEYLRQTLLRIDPHARLEGAVATERAPVTGRVLR